MATGGIFQLITNDGRQDRMLMATALLKKRLEIISQARARDPTVTDNTPTLVDIEKTHILFTNAHFKPFAAIGYEYNKVTPSATANETNSGDIQFSIPQFGDFFHDMAFHVRIRQPTLVYDAGLADADKPAMRWCDFPGERLMARTQFIVNGNPLDDYYFHAYNFYREFCVPPNKKTGWYRCMGQELPNKGFLEQSVTGVPDSHRVVADVCTGFQTPSSQKDQSDVGDVELFIPLLFWFNKDPRLSIPSVAIPYGQRFVTISLQPLSDLVGLVPRGSGTWDNLKGKLDFAGCYRKTELYINNIFVNPEIHDIFIKRIGFTLIRVHRQQMTTSTKSSDEILLQQLKWPIEALFVGMKLGDYTDSSVKNQHLDKWNSFSKVELKKYALPGSVRKTFAVSGLVAVTVTSGAVGGTATTFLTDLLPGDMLISPTGVQYPVVSVTNNTTATVSNATAGVASSALWTVQRYAPVSAVAKVQSRTVDSISIKAHGIPIYNDFPTGFYNAYVPMHYGGPNIMTPEDVGALMITFGLYPGTYQPSGHINVSRAREFYISYTSSVVDSNNTGNLVVLASAINFLLISDGSAVLRYST